MGRPKNNNGGLAGAASNIINGNFDLESFKKIKSLDKNVKFKDQDWIPVSQALQDALSIKGIPKGHITLLRGHSDTGKTTALLETAISSQKLGILPVFIITEMKWSWEHAKQMGFQIEEVIDEETGEVIDYKGFFLYVDRSSLNTIEDVAAFIADILNEQEKGRLPYDLCFLWDSSGSIPCAMSVAQNNNNPMWNAGAMATQFGNFINQKIILSRKENRPYTNTMVVVNKVGVRPPENSFSQPKMTNKAGDALYWDASLVLTFGNITNAGTSKIKATKNGKEVEFAKRTKVACDKNHINGLTTKSTIVVTIHGYIEDDKAAIDRYKKTYSKDWISILGSSDFDVVEDNSEWEENNRDIPLVSIEEDNG